MIQINNIRKKYGSSIILHGMTLRLEKGKAYGIVGENGAGKSTLFRCLAGLEHYQGNVIMEEHCRIGYLPDTPYFYPLVTGKEFLEFCLKAAHLPCTGEEINQYNKLFNLPLNSYPSKYSLGMRKRLMLMALMMQKCDFYIMDEPFNGLDVAGVIILKDWIVKRKREGSTFLISSHIISALTDICETLAYIHQGKMMKTYEGKEAVPKVIEDDLKKYILKEDI